MKIAKWISLGLTILSGIACLFFYLAPLVIGKFLLNDVKDASAIGIIGGADGPTSFFISSLPVFSPIMPIIFVLSLVSYLLLIFKSKNRINS